MMILIFTILCFYFFIFFSLFTHSTLTFLPLNDAIQGWNGEKSFFFSFMIFQAFDLSATTVKTCRRFFFCVSIYSFPNHRCLFFYRFICFCVFHFREARNLFNVQQEKKEIFSYGEWLPTFFICSFSHLFLPRTTNLFIFTSQTETFFRYCSVLIKNSQHESSKYFTQFSLLFSQPIDPPKFEFNNKEIFFKPSRGGIETDNVFRSTAFSWLTSETWETFSCVRRVFSRPTKNNTAQRIRIVVKQK